MPEVNAAFGEVVRRHLDVDFIASQNADAVLAHFARGVSKHFVSIVQLDAEHSVRKDFRHNSFKFEQVFFCHYGASYSV